MFSPRFLELQTAHHWGYKVYEWDTLETEERKAEAVAFMNVSSMMQFYNNYLNEKKQKK